MIFKFLSVNDAKRGDLYDWLKESSQEEWQLGEKRYSTG